MYLDRLKRLNPTLNCLVSLTDDLAMRQARQADAKIAAGRSRGPLHGIPWGCKDIIAAPGYPTQLGSSAFAGQVIDTEATVVRLLREAGAVLVAKLTTGELIQGDRWFGDAVAIVVPNLRNSQRRVNGELAPGLIRGVDLDGDVR